MFVRASVDGRSCASAVSQPIWDATASTEDFVVADIDGTAGTRATDEKHYAFDSVAAKTLQG